mgnify:CR=1 FL=1
MKSKAQAELELAADTALNHAIDMREDFGKKEIALHAAGFRVQQAETAVVNAQIKLNSYLKSKQATTT